VLVLEVHVVAFLGEFDHLAEAVHVELPDEGGEVAMSEVVRQHLLLHFLGLLDEHLVRAVPGEIVVILLFLRQGTDTSKMWYSLIMNSGIFSL
jgi:hypothetical protein